MLTARVFLAPHVPTLLLDEQRGHRTPMIEAYGAAARDFAAEEPVAAVVLSARWEAPGPFLADAARRHATLTDYYGLGVGVRYDCAGDPALARALIDAARACGVRAATAERGVDSGVSVPMHFLARRRLAAIVPISLARATAAEHRAWGSALRQALDAWPGRVALVVGGMLSYNVHAWTLRRETPEAQEFDARALDLIARGAWEELGRLEMRPHARALPEANLMHLEVLRGVLGADVAGRVLCYEPGPGVGAALVEFLAGEPRPVAVPAEGTVAAEGKRDPRLHVPVRVERKLVPRPVMRSERGRDGFRGPRGGMKRGTRGMVQRGARAAGRGRDPRPDTRPGERFRPRPDARPAERFRTKPDAKPGERFRPRPDARPAERFRPRPDARPGERPRPRSDARPGERSRPSPGAKPGARFRPSPGAKTGERPRPRSDARPGERSRPSPGAKPGARFRPRPGTKPGARPRPRSDARPGERSRPSRGAKPGARFSPRSGPRPGPKSGGSRGRGHGPRSR
jgi:aromatic ring-opening dioxygenase catalytic subunit (LigB family)